MDKNKWIIFSQKLNIFYNDLDAKIYSETYGQLYFGFYQKAPEFIDGIATIDLSTLDPDFGVTKKIYPHYATAYFGSTITRMISIIGITCNTDENTIVFRAVNNEVTPPIGINTSSFYVKFSFMWYYI